MMGIFTKNNRKTNKKSKLDKIIILSDNFNKRKMYNIYIDEKKKKENLKDPNQVEAFETLSYKKHRDKLSEKYRKKIQKYVIQMAKQGPNIKVSDYSPPITSSRMTYLEETKDKIRGRKGLQLGGFKNEKERIKETLKLNRMLYGSNEMLGKKFKMPIIKPVFHRYTGSQSSLLRKYARNNNYHLYDLSKSQRKEDNPDIFKTKFKSIMSIANEALSFKKLNKSTFEERKKYIPESNDFSEGDEKKDIYYDKFVREMEKRERIKQVKYLRNRNPKAVVVPLSEEDREKINKLKQFAFNDEFLTKNPDEIFKKNLMLANDDYQKREEEKIKMGKETFLVESDIDTIAKRVLVKCNANHLKSQNANTSLRIGEGKLMMTNGMTINEFLEKYNFLKS